MSSQFNSQLLSLSDLLQHLKDELASENITAAKRKLLERQLALTERAMKNVLEMENERRRTESS